MRLVLAEFAFSGVALTFARNRSVDARNAAFDFSAREVNTHRAPTTAVSAASRTGRSYGGFS